MKKLLLAAAAAMLLSGCSRSARQKNESAEDAVANGATVAFQIAVEATELDAAVAQRYQKALAESSLLVEDGKYAWAETPIQLAELRAVVTGQLDGNNYVLLHEAADKAMKQSPDGGWGFKKVRPTLGDWGPMVEFELDHGGATLFGKLTADNINKPLAAVVDGQVIMIAIVRERIGARGVISGRFTMQEVRDLARRMQIGPTSAPDAPRN